MSPEAQRIAIAEVCGTHTAVRGIRPDLNIPIYRLTDRNGKTGDYWQDGSACDLDFKRPSNYLSDLNAMNEAEKMLSQEQRNAYFFTLNATVARGEGFWHAIHAPASQRAEVLLRTLNLWEDGK